jgi:hypothetical protein
MALARRVIMALLDKASPPTIRGAALFSVV